MKLKELRKVIREEISNLKENASFNLDPSQMEEEARNMAGDIFEEGDPNEEEFINNVMGRHEENPFNSFDEFYAYCDGVTQKYM